MLGKLGMADLLIEIWVLIFRVQRRSANNLVTKFGMIKDKNNGNGR